MPSETARQVEELGGFGREAVYYSLDEWLQDPHRSFGRKHCHHSSIIHQLG